MSRLLVCGSVNLDLVVSVTTSPAAGETVMAQSLQEGLGGKGANQARAAATLGQDVELVAAVGEDEAGEQTRSELAAAGVRLDRLQIHAGPTGRAIVLLEPSGENRIVVVSGANAHLRPPEQQAYDGAAAVLCQLEAPLSTVRSALASGRGAGALTVLNAAPAVDGADTLLDLVDVLIVNEGEAAQLSGEDEEPAAIRALHRYGAKVVVLTLGERGAQLSRGGEVLRQPAFPVDVLDTTGAGDCFVGAFVSQLLRGAMDSEALRFACAAGALATTRPGAGGQPTAAEVAGLLHDVGSGR